MQVFYIKERMSHMEGLGERIRKIRKELNLTQKKFAQRIGVAATTMNNYEQNEREPPLKVLIEISRLAKVSIDWLLMGDNYESAIMKQLREREKELEEIKNINLYMLDNAERIKQVAERQEKYKSKTL